MFRNFKEHVKCFVALWVAVALGIVVISAGWSSAFAAMKSRTVHVGQVAPQLYYAPLYAALAKDFFGQNDLKVNLSTAYGADRATSMLVSGKADLILVGPERQFYMAADSMLPETRIFATLVRRDPAFLLSRVSTAPGPFDWNSVRGKKVLAWYRESTPTLMLEEAMRMNGIDPRSDVRLVTNVSVRNFVKAWKSKVADYAIFFEPLASFMERAKPAKRVAWVGEVVGRSEYSVFIARNDYIENQAEIIQAWTSALQRGLTWLNTADPAEAGKLILDYIASQNPKTFGPMRRLKLGSIVSAVRRYRQLGIWGPDVTVSRTALGRIPKMMVASDVAKAAAFHFDRMAVERFAETAKRAAR